MIKSDNGVVEIDGTKHELMTDLSMIVHALTIAENVLTKSELDGCIKRGLLSLEEAKEMASDTLKNIILDLLEGLSYE